MEEVVWWAVVVPMFTSRQEDQTCAFTVQRRGVHDGASQNLAQGIGTPRSTTLRLQAVGKATGMFPGLLQGHMQLAARQVEDVWYFEFTAGREMTEDAQATARSDWVACLVTMDLSWIRFGSSWWRALVRGRHIIFTVILKKGSTLTASL